MRTLELPIRVNSRTNSREHWRKKAERSAAERRAVALIGQYELRCVKLPCTVTLTRLGKRYLDDDNIRDALKAVRDEVARQLALPNDADPRVRWVYQQHAPADYAVRIEVEEAGDKHAPRCSCGGSLETFYDLAGAVVGQRCARCSRLTASEACVGCLQTVAALRTDGFCSEACAADGPKRTRSRRSLGS